ncbi:MAG TPA: hypothetical protein DHW02_04275 [Ktedonobacter sp.]|nr:hypothetical protein [Ktedonobacter sp.]
MPLLRPNLPFPVCPRCKAALTHDATVCNRCGYYLQAEQTKMSGVQQQNVQSGYQGNQTIQTAPTTQAHQFRQFHQMNQANWVHQNNQISNNEMQPARQPFNEVQGSYQAYPQPVRPISPEWTPVTEVRSQVWYPSHQSTTDAFSSNSISMESMQADNALYRATSNRVRSVHASLPSQNQPRVAPHGKKDERSQSQTKRALTYFVCVILATAALVFAVFHEADQSLLSLISHPASTSTTATYAMPKGTPLFADTFSSDASGWNLQSVPGTYQVSVGNGKMMLEDDKNSLLWELLPGQQTYDNFILSVNATLSKGDANNGYGVYIRGTSNAQTDLATYYRFELYGDSSYAIFKGVTNQSGASAEVKLTNFIVNPAIQKLGKPNHIMIIAKGSSLSFVVNKQLLTTIKDNSYASGSIALFVSNLTGVKPGAQVQLSQLAIYPN